MDPLSFKYPNYGRIIYFLSLLMGLFMAVLALILPILGLINNNYSIVEEPMPVPVGILATGFILLITFSVNMMFPEIWVQGNGFKLRTTIYRSRVLRWEDILYIKENHLSSKRHKIFGVGIDDIHPLYSFIGFIQLMDGKAFLISQRIQGYEDLMKLIEEKRPDLFQEVP